MSPNDRDATILVVDDTPESLAVLVRILGHAGYVTQPVDSGEEALASAMTSPPDLILLDIQLQGIDGFQVLQRLKRHPLTRAIPVMLVSAFADSGEWVEGLRLGAVDFLSKPFQALELLSRVKTHIALRHANLSVEQQTDALRRINQRLEAEVDDRKKVEELLRAHLTRAERSRMALLSALEDLKQAESLVAIRARQQEVIVELGVFALGTTELQPLFDLVVSRVAQTFQVELSKILELQPDGTSLKLVAGVGWRDGLVGTAMISAGPESQAGFSLRSKGSVVVENLTTETRFSGPDILRDHGVLSGASTVIPGEGRPFGVLGTHSTRMRRFSPDDLHFLHAAANVLAEAIHRHQIEAGRRAALEELLRSNRELEQFAYVASHDLQEPLRMVASYTQLLGERYADKLDQDARDFIGFAVDGAQRMQRLIQDLLSYSRVTTKGQPHCPVALPSVLGEVLTSLQASILETGAVIAAEDLPVVLGDRTQLVQLMQNLVANGIKFNRSGESTLVRITATRDPDAPRQWVIAVQDNGIGIDPKYFERLFVIFQRLHARREYPGTGIGLALCKRIVERHKGRIWLTSEPNLGTTFYFTLPEAPTAAAAPIAALLETEGTPDTQY